jgi:hypothetical protein
VIFKRHLCGVGIIYEEIARTEKSGLSISTGRPNGSLYSRQKRAIADGVEYMRLHATKERKPVIFCLTSPGLTDAANAPKFISRFIDNMKQNYGMGNYVWVREMTQQGFPHFHFIADWHLREWFLERPTTITRAEEISKYWSSLFSQDAGNSIRFGSYPSKRNPKKRTWYVTSPRQAWYLCKYIGKTFGKALNSTEEVTAPKSRYRKFGMSEALAELSQPTLFHSEYITDRIERVKNHVMFREEWKMKEAYVDVDIKRRVWCDSDGVQIEDDLLKDYDWKWTSHGQTYIGMNRVRSA